MTIDLLHLLLEAKDSPSKARLECIPDSTCRWACHIGHPVWPQELDRILTECKCKLVGAHNMSFQSLWPETSKNTHMNTRKSLAGWQSYIVYEFWLSVICRISKEFRKYEILMIDLNDWIWMMMKLKCSLVIFMF